MEKYKVCPSCGEHNDPRNMECDSCGTDLMGVPVVDAAREQSAANQEAKEPREEPLSGGMVKICDCGARNPAQARKCQSCGEDISDIIPTAAAEEVELHYQLSSLDGGFLFLVPCGTVTIGREQEMQEYLSKKPFVSRAHAKLTVEEGKLYIENLSSTNYTYVNNKRIPAGRQLLNADDEVALGGIEVEGKRQDEAAYFIVGIVP